MEKQQICAIFAGGPEAGEPCMPVPDGAYILCADSGLHLAERLGCKPDLVLGDFDSLGAVPTALPHMTVPVEKDDTDTMLAARVALEKGFRDVRIFGAFCGRLDHTLANIQLLAMISQKSMSAYLYGKDHVYTCITNGSIVIPAKNSGYVSVFAHSDVCSGVSIKGLMYELENGELRNNFALGVSNEFIGKEAEISVKSGTLCVYYEI